MRTKTVECSVCGTKYERRAGAVNEALRNGWKFYCSRMCISKAKNKKHYITCSCCGKNIVKRNSAVKQSKTGKVFCSHSCSCKFSNINRRHGADTKDKISQSLQELHIGLNHYVICKNCKKSFKSRIKSKRIFCSRKCRDEFERYTLEETISKFFEMKTKLDRIPLKNEVNTRLKRAIVYYFGQWNKFIIDLGFQPNVKWLIKKNLKCRDGHLCDSTSELIIDDWLFKNKIEHERRKKYPEGKYNCDFYLPEYGLWVEYFGLYGDHEDYDKTVEIKRDMILKYGLKMIELFRYHLYPVCKLNEIFDFARLKKIDYKQMEFDLIDQI